MSTLVAMTRNRTISAYYRRLRATDKPSKAALVACIKLAVILNVLIRGGTPWAPQPATP